MEHNCLTDLINSNLVTLDSSITDETLDNMYNKYKAHKNVFIAYVEVRTLNDLMKKDPLRYEKYSFKFTKLSIELQDKLKDFKFNNDVLENESIGISYLVNVSNGYEDISTEGTYTDIDLAKSHLEKVDIFPYWAGIQEVENNKPIDKPNHGYIYKKTVDGIIDWDKTSHIEF